MGAYRWTLFVAALCCGRWPLVQIRLVLALLFSACFLFYLRLTLRKRFGKSKIDYFCCVDLCRWWRCRYSEFFLVTSFTVLKHFLKTWGITARIRSKTMTVTLASLCQLNWSLVLILLFSTSNLLSSCLSFPKESAEGVYKSLHKAVHIPLQLLTHFS